MASTNKLRELDCNGITCDLDKFVAGSGGFGDVIFGYHNGLKKEVAIKIFKVAGATHKKSLVVKMFQEEMEHLLKADHKNVVRIFGYVQWSFAMGIVMEYCKGGDLETLLMDTSKELGLAVRVRILYEIASAMAFCHNLPDKRLIHQDLKPGNIMLTEKLQCKVGDFGSAEMATHSTSATVNPLARSKKERLQYTPYYTAPEKLKDLTMKPRKEHDVYAFGMIFYWLLARKAPYPRLAEEERRELFEQIKKGKRPDCQEIQDWMQTLVGEDIEIAELLQLLMKRCWDQDPTKRPTMTKISEELKNLLEKQNPENLLSQAASVAREMVVNQPSTNESQRVPLHYFSPRTGRFEVPSTTSNRTVGRPTEPAGGAQEHGSSQQGEIPTSSRSQQPDSTEGTESREVNTSIEITQPKTSTVDVSREIPQPQHPDSSNPASTGFQRSTESTEESSHSSKSPQQHAREPTGGDQEQVSSPSQPGEISTSGRSQHLDQTRPARTLVKEIPHSSKSQKQPTGGISSLRKAKLSLRKLFGVKTGKNPTLSKNAGDDFNQFVQKYVDLLKTKKYDEAKTTKQQLSRSFEGQLAITADDLKAEATKFRKDGKYLEAILFFSIAADFYVKKNPDSAVAKSEMGCAREIRETIELLMKNLFSKSRNREIVRNHVIPLMRDMIQQIRDLQINEEIRCEMEAWCLVYIERSQDYIGELASRETTLKLGLELMETKFGNESSKYHVYGILLNNLGVVCEKTSRIKEAVEYYTKANEVYKTAEDLTEEKRGESIAISERNLQIDKAKLNK